LKKKPFIENAEDEPNNAKKKKNDETQFIFCSGSVFLKKMQVIQVEIRKTIIIRNNDRKVLST